MKLFLSYAASDRSVAEDISSLLNASGFGVFFDRKSLPAGRSYTGLIKASVEDAAFFVFLVSPASIRPGCYALTELRYWEDRQPNPDGKVLPVMVKPTLLSRLPPYLKTVTPLFPRGSLAVSVLDAVRQLIVPEAAGQPTPAPREQLFAEFHPQRLQAYRLLWQTTRTLPRWPKPPNLPYAALADLSERLRDWYFIGGHGLFLTRAAHHRYSAVQNELEAVLMAKPAGSVDDQHYEEIRQACSALRTQLAADIGSRT